MKPKYVKGTKRYGRRSRPDKTDLELTAHSEDSPAFGTDPVEINGVRRAKLRRSTSLESVEVKFMTPALPFKSLGSVTLKKILFFSKDALN